MTRRPRWINFDAVEDFAITELETPDFTEFLTEHEYVPWLRKPERPREKSDAEIADAEERGDLASLLSLILPISFWKDGKHFVEVNPAVHKLSPTTWMTIVMRLEGDVWFAEPKKTKPPGRSRMTKEERERKFPIYAAAEEALGIAFILKKFYPDQRSKSIKDRAIIIAARRAGMEPERLALHLKRPGRRRAV